MKRTYVSLRERSQVPFDIAYRGAFTDPRRIRPERMQRRRINNPIAGGVALGGLGYDLARRAAGGVRRIFTPFTANEKAIMRVARMAKHEVKRHNVTINGGSSIDNNGSVTHLTNIDQGVTESTRVGLSCKLVSVEVRGWVTVNSAATATTVRVVIFQDKSMDDVTPTVAHMFDSTDPAASRNNDNIYKFNILYDKIITLGSASNQRVPIRFFKKMKLSKCRWNDNDGDNTRQGQLWILTIGDESTNYPTGYLRATVRFTDA